MLTLTTNKTGAHIRNVAGGEPLVQIGSSDAVFIPRTVLFRMMPGTTVACACEMALAVTMAANWIAAGRPQIPTEPKAIFEAMDRAWRRDQSCPICFAGPVEHDGSGIDYRSTVSCAQCGTAATEDYPVQHAEPTHAGGYSYQAKPFYQVEHAA